MNKSLNVFLSVLLCFVLYAGVLTSLYTTDDSASQHYQTEYTSSIPTGIGAPSVSFGVGARGNDLAVPMSSRPSRGSVRHLSSHRLVTSSPNSPIASSPNSLTSSPNSLTSSPNSLITYTSSSQTMKSFGGGSNAAGVSMSSGVVSSNATSSPTSFVSMSSNLPSPLAYYPQSTTSFDGAQLTFAASSLQEIGASAVSYGASAPRGISGRRNASSIGGNLDDWIQGLINEYGWLYSDGEIDYFDKQILENLYKNAIANGELPEGVSWEMFLSWFGNQSDRYAFPIPSGIWFMCILAFGYGLYIAYRRKQKVVNS